MVVGDEVFCVRAASVPNNLVRILIDGTDSQSVGHEARPQGEASPLHGDLPPRHPPVDHSLPSSFPSDSPPSPPPTRIHSSSPAVG